MEPTFKVPIRNLFCMFSYVNDMPEFIDQFSDVDENLITYDFLARKFNDEVRKLLDRGLVKNYIEHTEETGFISGRMLMNESMPLIVEKKPLVVCEKDEYSPDIIFNQIMKTTLSDLYRNLHIKEKTRNNAFLLWEEMPSVNETILSREMLIRLHFHRHNVHYKRVIHIARLLYELKLLSHKSGDWSLFTVEMKEGELNRLFEKFLLHFFQYEQREYKVKSERMSWKLEGNQSLLPTMLTDVSLTHRKKNEKMIIDAKFYRHMFQTYLDKNSFHSHNMYQLFTYLMHQPGDYDLRGILIYPANEYEEMYERYQWSDRVYLEVISVSLDAKWEDIRWRLLALIEYQEN